MGKYLKMADVFKGELFIDCDNEEVIVDGLSLTVLESFSGVDAAKFALHAINSHDELVAEVERLRGIIDAIADCEIDDAPHGYSHEESSAWSSGYNYLAMKIRDAI